MSNSKFTRRNFLQLSGLSGTSLLLGGCGIPIGEGLVGAISQPLNEKVETLIFKPQTLVPEFTTKDIEPEGLIVNSFRGNPTIDPANYRLVIDGEVNNPLNISMADIQQLPLTSMIIRHVCVEGWATIVQWGGVRLRDIVALASPKENVKFAYFESADGYYSSWDIASATHPQTLLAYQKNGEALPLENGAPLRLASAVKLGYKQSKWVTRITLVSQLSRYKGYWEDMGYEWFAGI
jgi:DMSO/TMAO reductase YedYZ molybdopterin-dependent catalytic subunit